MRKLYLMFIVGVVLLLVACHMEPKTTPMEEIQPSPVSEQLVALLPQEDGYQWRYDGFAEYGHEMSLNSIDIDDTQVVYELSGQVDDMSAGESKKDYSLSVTYTVTSDVLTQRIDGEMLMDSSFPELELIRLPLKENASWEQKTKDEKGKTITLKCVIEKVSKDAQGRAIYAVQYNDTDSDYYERREILEGVGVLSFEKLYMPGTDEPFVVGYRLYQPES